MAPRRSRSDNDGFAVRVVKMVDKQGREHHESTAIGVNNLVYGQGYKVVSHDNVDEALAYLAGEDSPREEAAATPNTD